MSALQLYATHTQHTTQNAVLIFIIIIDLIYWDFCLSTELYSQEWPAISLGISSATKIHRNIYRNRSSYCESPTDYSGRHYQNVFVCDISHMSTCQSCRIVCRTIRNESNSDRQQHSFHILRAVIRTNKRDARGSSRHIFS